MSVTNDVSIVLTGLVSSCPPLLYAGSGEYVAERAGTLNISVEAMMLNGAFFGIVGGDVLHSVFLGVVLGGLAGLVVGVVHANFSHRLAANTFVVGLTLNALILGLTDFFSTAYPNLLSKKVTPFAIPGLSHIPAVGNSLFTAPWLAYGLIVVIPGVWWLLARTRWGLEVRSVGENSQAADATGVRVNRRRRQTLYLCGFLSGVGGAYLSLAVVGVFNQDMTDGIGYVVIAAVIFGGWTLKGTVIGCLLFGGVTTLQLILPAFNVTLNGNLLVALPYLAALAAMIFLAARHRSPRELARPFVRGIT